MARRRKNGPGGWPTKVWQGRTTYALVDNDIFPATPGMAIYDKRLPKGHFDERPDGWVPNVIIYEMHPEDAVCEGLRWQIEFTQQDDRERRARRLPRQYLGNYPSREVALRAFQAMLTLPLS
jgi:hypothetical protein